MKKTMKFVAISLMALALFSCNKKNNEPCTASVLSLRIDEATLRALEESQVATDPNETKTEVTSGVVLTLHPSGSKITLSPDQLTAAKTAQGTQIDVSEVVSGVSMTANGLIKDAETHINTLQSKTLKTEIPLEAPETNVTTTTSGDNTIYKVTLNPVPVVARLEVFGKIQTTANTAGVNAFESVKVKHVYMNNYLAMRAGNRVYTESNGTDGFATTPALDGAMHDVITDEASFENGTKVAGYQLFPKKASETASKDGAGYFDHVVLELEVTYTEEAKLAGSPSTPQKRFVTIQRFMKANTGDLDATGFLAGTIYKLNLNEVVFKTNDKNLPDPVNPDTPDPEPKGDRKLEVKIMPFTWTVENIKPDINDGYKK